MRALAATESKDELWQFPFASLFWLGLSFVSIVSLASLESINIVIMNLIIIMTGFKKVKAGASTVSCLWSFQIYEVGGIIWEERLIFENNLSVW